MKNLIFVSLVLAVFMTACYDDYKTDYDYTASYFAHQYPARTLIVDSDAETVDFKVGAVYGGRYTYGGTTETVNFSIEDTLVTNYPEYMDMGIKVMPESWYTLSDDSEIKMVNSNLGYVDVSIIKDSLVKYPEATMNTYAIPFVMTEATTDSILEGKNYQILVVKFKNEFDGRYYVKGIDNTLNVDGTVASSIEYNNPSLVLNKYIFLNTISKDELTVPRIGAMEDADKFVYNLQFDPEDGSSILSPFVGSDITDLVGAASYDYDSKSFVCNYDYKYNGVNHTVIDTLIYSNTELVLESWK